FMNTGCFGCSSSVTSPPMTKAPLGSTTISGHSGQSRKAMPDPAGGRVCARPSAIDASTSRTAATATRETNIMLRSYRVFVAAEWPIMASGAARRKASRHWAGETGMTLQPGFIFAGLLDGRGGAAPRPVEQLRAGRGDGLVEWVHLDLT